MVPEVGQISASKGAIASASLSVHLGFFAKSLQK